MCSLCVAILTDLLLQVKTFVLYPYYYVCEGFDNEVLTLQIYFYWAAVLIPTLIALKNLMLVSSMWPMGPLVVFNLGLFRLVFNMWKNGNV